MTPSPSPVAAVLAELEGLLAKATPGEWSRWDAPDCTAVAAQVRYTHGVPSNPLFWVASQMTYRDAELIVAMHTALPRLLAAIRAVDELADYAEDQAEQNDESASVSRWGSLHRERHLALHDAHSHYAFTLRSALAAVDVAEATE